LDLSTYFSHWQQIKWEVARHKIEEKITEACQNHEKELADMKAANTVLKAQLERALADFKEVQQQTADRQAALKEEVSGLEKKICELSKNEVEIREQFENEIEHLKKRMAEPEILHKNIEADMQIKDSRLVEALAKVEAAEKELQLKNAEIEEFKNSEVEESKRRIEDLEVDKQTLEDEVQRLHEQIEASDELLAKSDQLLAKATLESETSDELLAKQEAEIQNLKSGMERAIELTKFLHEEVSRSSARITDLKSVGSKTDGISFSTENTSACMVGGNDRQSNRNETNGEKDVMSKANEIVTGGLGKIIGRVGSTLLEVRDLKDLRADTIQM
jgi:chromosome segregation ATPase